MSQKENWEKEFDEKFDGLWLFLATEYKSFDAGENPKASIKSFIRETIAKREKEIADYEVKSFFRSKILSECKKKECDWERKLLDLVDNKEAGYVDFSELIREVLSAREKEIAEEVEKMKKNLVVDNWKDGKPQNCNPRCHDTGREEVIETVLSILKH